MDTLESAASVLQDLDVPAVVQRSYEKDAWIDSILISNSLEIGLQNQLSILHIASTNSTADPDMDLFVRNLRARIGIEKEAWTPHPVPACICGQCLQGTCEARANLLRWLLRRSLQPNWRHEASFQDVLRIDTSIASSISDDEEESGLRFVESELPFDDFDTRAPTECPSCQGFGIAITDSVAPDIPPDMVIPLYRVKRAAKSCGFCRLLQMATATLVKPFSLYSFRSSQYSMRFEAVKCILRVTDAVAESFSTRSLGDRSVSLSFSPPPLHMHQHSGSAALLHYIAIASTGESFASGRMVAESETNPQTLKTWLSECVVSHGVLCNDYHLPNADGKLRSLRLVDVHDFCIIQQTPGLQYIALSYVWGQATSLQLTKENEIELKRMGGLRPHVSKIPQTFLDAFEVVKCIGQRYIWIDALCITQDAEDKEAHMQDMHLVYGAALFTIVAGGDDASSGLPGVRKGSRFTTQVWQKLSPGVGIALSLPLPASIQASRWSLRSWTYQEQLLSNRFLIFFDNQVLWQCPSSVKCEDTMANNKTTTYERLRHFSSPSYFEKEIYEPEVNFGFRRSHAFQRYADIVMEYTGRELTFSEDILHAFSGISKVLMLDLNSEMVEGLPTALLDAALLWQPCYRLCKRKAGKGFASWSWAGWEGKVTYPDTKKRHDVEALLPIIKWHVHQSDAVNRFGIGIKPYLLNPAIERSTWNPPFEPDPTAILGAVPSGAQLKFWTSCSIFRNLSGKQPQEEEVYLHETTSISVKRLLPQQFQIKSDHGRPLGVLTMTGTGFEGIDPSRHEFIVVSEAQFAGINLITWQPVFSAQSKKCLMYNVMLIEWNKEKTCAFRVGLGQIMKTAWAQSKPRNRHITLG